MTQDACCAARRGDNRTRATHATAERSALKPFPRAWLGLCAWQDHRATRKIVVHLLARSALRCRHHGHEKAGAAEAAEQKLQKRVVYEVHRVTEEEQTKQRQLLGKLSAIDARLLAMKVEKAALERKLKEATDALGSLHDQAPPPPPPAPPWPRATDSLSE